MKKVLSVLLSMLTIINIVACLTISSSAANYDSVKTARQMYSGTTYYGTISRSDEIDFYKITVSKSSTFNVYAYGVIAGFWVTVYDVKGNIIAENRVGKSSSGITTYNRDIQVIAGEYYVRVKHNDYNANGSREDIEYGDYQVKVSLSTANESFAEKLDGARDTITSPNSINMNSNYIGQIAFNDYEDFYKFTVTDSSRVSINIKTTYLRMIYGNIYSADGEHILSFESSENNAGIISDTKEYELVSGTYLLKLSKGDYRHDGGFSDYECGAYTFMVKSVSSNESFKETQTHNNNTFEASDRVVLNTAYTGQIADNDNIDYYRFNITNPTRLTISITARMCHMVLCLFDENGDILIDEYMSGDEGHSYWVTEIELDEGIYYIGFSQVEGYIGSYDFRLTDFIDSPKVKAVNTLKGVRVTWNEVDNAVKYVVYRRLGTSSVWDIIATTTGTSYDDTGALKAGNYYVYSVKAYNASGTPGQYIKANCATVQRVIAPYTKAKNALGGINVTWGKVAGANKYVVLRRIGTESTWKTLCTTTGTSFLDNNVTPGVYYIYSIRAVNNTGYSEYDINKRITVQRVVAPYTKAANAVNGINVTWNKVDGATKYVVLRRIGTESTWKTLCTTTSTSFLDKNVTTGVYYIYSIRAVNGTGYSEYDVNKRITVQRIVAPVVKVQNRSNGVHVSWNKINGATKYNVYRRLSGTSSWIYIGTITGTGGIDKGAVKGKTYSYSVRAINGTGYSAFDSSKCATIRH